MGNTASGPAASALQFLSEISGSVPVGLHDPSWSGLTTSLQSGPLAQFEPSKVQIEIRPRTASLVYHNAQTLNCQRLLLALTQHLGGETAQKPTIGLANAVYVVRAILMDLIEQLNTAQLLTFIEVPPAALTGELGPELKAEFGGLFNGSLVLTLIRNALGSLKPLDANSNNPAEYLFQLEVMNLLLVMFSTELYAPPSHVAAPPPPIGMHVYLDAAMDQRDLASHAVQTLLTHFISSQAPPSSLALHDPGAPRSTFYMVRSAASSVFWLPYTAYTMLRRSGNQPVQDPSGSPVADTAVSLLLALHFYAAAPGVGAGNPYRQALRQLRDADEMGSEEAAEGGRGVAAGSPAVPYAALFDALGRALVPRESTILLLYALLHGTPHFNEYCMARSDVDCLLLPILELLYSVQERSANQLYMLLIVLLILSQDPAFAVNVHRVTLRSVPFYKERSLNSTTLGSLLVVLLLRTAHYNLSSLKDVYLHTNTLATLANLAPHMSNLSCHAAQRLVSLLHLLDRRHSRLKAEAVAAAAAGSGMESEETTERRTLELQLYSDFLRIVLEIVNAILTNALPSNPELVYTLLHRQEVFASFRADSKYSELMENVTLVVDYFGKKVEEAGRDGAIATADRVLEVIKLHSRGWRRDRLRAFPELRFTYEEEASPAEFFVPYVWSHIVSLQAIPWTLPAITAFVPLLPKEGGGEEAAPLSALTSPFDVPLTNRDARPDDKNASNV